MEEILKVDRRKRCFKVELDELLDGKLIELLKEHSKGSNKVDFKYGNGILTISSVSIEEKNNKKEEQ